MTKFITPNYQYSAHAIVRLTRLDSSVLVFLSVFLPVFARTRDFGLSLNRALPVLFIAICTFVVNDLDDVESDRINHPERALPSGQVTQIFATILYFFSLGLALFTIKYYIPQTIAFWYYALLTLVISYSYVKEYLPSFKSFYVAATSTLPILIIASFYPSETELYLFAISCLLFVLGRELCMDLIDKEGDVESFVHRHNPTSIAVSAFLLQSIGFILLTRLVEELLDVVFLCLLAFLIFLAIFYWFKFGSMRKASILMKVQLFVGLYFLA